MSILVLFVSSAVLFDGTFPLWVSLNILQNSQESACARASFSIKMQDAKMQDFVKKETLAQVFSRDFWNIFNNTFFIEHLLWLSESRDLKDGEVCNNR